MFQGRSSARVLYSLLYAKAGISKYAIQVQKTFPSTTMQYSSRNLHNLPMKPIKEIKFSNYMPWIIGGGICGWTAYEFFLKTSWSEQKFKDLFHAACAGDERKRPSHQDFLQTHVLGMTLEEIKDICPLQLAEKLRFALGKKYLIKDLNTMLLIDAKTLEEKMKKEIDAIFDDAGNERRPDQWRFEAIDADDFQTHEYAGMSHGPPSRVPTVYFWMPSTYDLLYCYLNGNEYNYAIGKGYKVLVGLEELTDPVTKQKIHRPFHFAGTSKDSFKQNRFQVFNFGNFNPGPSENFKIQNSVMDYVNKTTEGLIPFCPKRKPQTHSQMQTIPAFSPPGSPSKSEEIGASDFPQPK